MEIDWSKVATGKLFLAAMQQIHECQMCGKCCTGMDGIALCRQDTRRMSEHLGMAEKKFIKKYTVQSSKKPSDRLYITEGEDQHCPFLTSHGCSQYEGRGQVCRFYPWTSPENMARMDDKKSVVLYDRCEGMRITYRHVLEASRFMTRQHAIGVTSGNIGKICLLLTIAMEGRHTEESLLAALGLKELPENFKAQVWEYAVAHCAQLLPGVREEILRQLNDYANN